MEVLSFDPQKKSHVREPLYAEYGGSFLENCPPELWKGYASSDDSSCIFVANIANRMSGMSISSAGDIHINEMNTSLQLKPDHSNPNIRELETAADNDRIPELDKMLSKKHDYRVRDGNESMLKPRKTSTKTNSIRGSSGESMKSKLQHSVGYKHDSASDKESGYKIRKPSPSSSTSVRSIRSLKNNELTQAHIDRLYKEENRQGLRKIKEQLQEHARLLKYLQEKEKNDVDYRQKKLSSRTINEGIQFLELEEKHLSNQEFYDHVDKTTDSKLLGSKKLKRLVSKQKSKPVKVNST